MPWRLQLGKQWGMGEGAFREAGGDQVGRECKGMGLHSEYDGGGASTEAGRWVHWGSRVGGGAGRHH